jgi:hypothetical protein
VSTENRSWTKYKSLAHQGSDRPNLLHHALKAACENIPFEMFCPAENNITRHNIKEVCCIRFGFAIASLGMGAGNYLRDRKNRTISKGN